MAPPSTSEEPRTLADKIWDRHVVESLTDGPDLVAIDLQYVHEASSLQAFDQLAERGLSVAHPERTLAVMDHVVPVRTDRDGWTANAAEFTRALAANCSRYGIPCIPYLDRRQGIAHVVGPELGLTLPGMTIVCGDSHTSTHGALGAVAFGIGTTQVAHELATQSLLVTRPRTMEVVIDGQLQLGATAKDLALALIAAHGNLGGVGHAIEFRGEAVESLSIEGRMTLCNMGIEFGSRMNIVAPDATTLAYLKSTPLAPFGEQAAREAWADLRSDEGASFDSSLRLDANAIAPQVSWGTSPAQSTVLGGEVPDPASAGDSDAVASAQRALEYMGLTAGTPLRDVAIDAAFIGSCTNSRIEDLRAATQVLRGRKVAAGVTAVAVPGSMRVKLQAEAEGLDRIFREAGFSWNTAGCSLCIAANGQVIPAGARCASTTNRNFEGRQGTGARTHLMSPASVAASAVAGRLVAPAEL
jgi:3-isopropylmalate/(R)-2-methylmalate dehydratase large subunit